MGILTVLAAAEGATPAIDTGLVTEVVNLIKSVMGLFAVFPLNVLLIGGFAFMGFRLVGSAKNAAM